MHDDCCLALVGAPSSFMTIGARIAVARERKGFSQTELAKRLGTAVLTVNRWEMGHTEPNAKNLHALAVLLDVRPTWLFDGTGPMEESRLERDDDPYRRRPILARFVAKFADKYSAETIKALEVLAFEAGHEPSLGDYLDAAEEYEQRVVK